MTRPIRPEEAVAQKQIPDAVLRVFNELITESYNGIQARVLQEEVVKRLVSAGLNRAEIFEKGWLDVEGIFEAAGWEVEYDKPGYNETYDAFFVFRGHGLRETK